MKLAVLFLSLLTGVSAADPPNYVIATIAGYVPGATPVALQQHLTQPVLVAYDPYGNLYYATTHQVWRLNPDQTATLIAGTGSADSNHLGDGGPATAASLTWIAGLAIDGQQNVYLSDLVACEIRKVTPAGVITRFAGTGAQPLYLAQSNASASTPALKVPLTPGPLAIDSANLYVSDAATSSVLAFTLDGRGSRVVAGNHGSATAGDGGPASSASLFYPGTLALSTGALYVNEAGGARIRQVTFRTGAISTLLLLAQTYLVDNGNPGLAADPDGTLYLQRGHSISRIAPGTSTPQPWAGGGDSNPGDPGPAQQATLLTPASLAVNPLTHDLSLADVKGNIIQTVSASAGDIQTVAGMVHFAGDNGPAAAAIFNGLEAVVSDAQGNLFVADTGNNRVRKIDSSGIVTTIAGTGIIGFSGDNGPATQAALNLKHAPSFANSLTIDSSGSLYLSDFGNGRIRKIDSSGVITTVAGGGRVPAARGVPATSASLQPGPLAVDSSGSLYFGNVVTGSATTIPIVYRIGADNQLTPFAGGTGTMQNSGPALTSQIGYAYCLAADALDNIYLCDTGYNRVRKVGSGLITNIAGNGNPLTGPIQAGPPTKSAIGAPTSIAVDKTGNLFFYSSGQVAQIDASGTLQPFAGFTMAAPISSGDGGNTSQATFSGIAGMAFDASGKLYLSDGGVFVREAMPVGPDGPPPIISSNGIVGAGASNPPVQLVSPGAIVSIFGTNFLGSGNLRTLQPADLVSGKLPTNLGGVCVTFGGVNASITGVFPNQINVQVPDLPPGPVTVRVTANCGSVNPVAGPLSAVTVGRASPEFFSSPDPVSGRNLIAATINGGIVEAYGTGWGVTIPAIPPGAIPGMAAQLAAPPALLLGGTSIPPANILYAGASPCCAGLYQVDFTLPAGTPSGTLPLVITIGGISSPASSYLTVP